MKLTIIIVNYNVKHYLIQCLTSVRRATKGIDCRVFVVDNHSRDDSVATIKERFPEFTLISSLHNLGFAKANNVVLRQVESDYILLLNPDTILGESTLHQCLAFADKQEHVGAIGVKMLQCNGKPAKESRRGVPTPLTAFYKMCGLCARFPNSPRFGKYYMSGLSWDEAAEIDIVSGAFCLLTREALQATGGLDEDYFMYGEDIDLSYRLLKKGFHNWYYPSSILHYKGESTEKSSFRYVHVFYDAMIIFLKKHFAHLSFWLAVPMKMAIYAKASLTLISTLAFRLYKALGFTVKGKNIDAEYVFVGPQKMLTQCRQMAERHGLKAYYEEGQEEALRQIHQSLIARFRNSRLVYLVYDALFFHYDTLLNIISETPYEHICLGTFYSDTQTIITDKEVIE